MTIVIPTLDSGDMLIRALKSVEIQSVDAIEIVLVDNGSSDGSLEMATSQFPSSKVIRHETNTGFAPACNEGAAAGTGRYVVFLNSDAILTEGCLSSLIEAADRDPGTAVWQPLILDVEHEIDSAGDLFSWTGFLWHRREPGGPGAVPVFSVKGACMLVRQEVFLELEGFREEFFAYFEESDLCWRARMAGYEVKLLPTAVVEHVGFATATRVFQTHEIHYLAYRNRLLSIASNASTLTLWRVLPVHLVLIAGISIAMALSGRPRSFLSIWRAIFWLFLNFGESRNRRARSQAGRRISDAQIFYEQVVAPIRLAEGLRLLSFHLRRRQGG
ncbi:MAG: glycosyltransferase family 2 protein [Actinobacteria bacterium]|nr:glycosyltransferase family 2 protein [Actinomycetota bacterium]